MAAPSVHQRLLTYQSQLQERPPGNVDLVVVHCTELPDLEMARRFAERIHYLQSGTGNSGHFYLDRDGTIEQWVDVSRVAHHTRGFNERSIGIELVNLGRYPDWLHSARQSMREAYPAGQIDALIGLLEDLCATLPGLQWIAGHQDLDSQQVPASDDPARTVRRKLDPGPLFPWRRVLSPLPLQRYLPAR
jgi:N-acetylmuramoyl-L-alanine amidase